ncbi:caspase family protein [Bradyrhizobium sp. CCBAU 51765]|uniref:caspase family protein n=1 Tax=Bradyrhizobium sp. CCBAU 51765 TaxID=1325102 RepID=UPI00188786E2|nr:caspase family protein [Bradyrhizobium sp. CCBAU 51765]QOZ11874.1 caspase family protein [Bradyrhizobium sp. CCBAU 51765]
MGTLRKIVYGMMLAGWCFAGGPAFADKRVALIIGNSGYDKVARLPNPANDAALVAETFKSAGFDSIDLRRDLRIEDMRRALRDFVDKAGDADVAVVYYAGHGIEIDGINYLIPVDAVLDRDRDVYDEALSLERVLVAVEPAKKLRLVILDACRDNPFTRSMKRTLASRAVGRGLAKVEPTSPNTLIAFASKAGSTASDGDGKYSPFTRALVNHVAKPGLDVRKAFGYVRDDVLKSTGNKQEPYLYGSLGGDDLPLVPAKPAATGPQADPQTAVRRDYELALQIGTRDVWTAFLAQYPDGFYASLAKGQLARIAAEDARLAAAEKARLAEQEKARLAAEGARQVEQAKAVAAAKAAEEARIAAEKANQVAQQKAAAAEKARLAEQEKARLAAEKTKQIEPQKAATAKQAELAAEKAGEEKGQQLAAVAPVDQLEKPPVDLPRALQAELRRVGCNPGAVDGNWGERSQKALNLFNTHSGLRLEAKAATIEALDAVKGKSGRTCPLVCDPGYKAEGESCLRTTCPSGYRLNGNECIKVREVGPASAQSVEGIIACSQGKQACLKTGGTSDACQQRYQSCVQTGCWMGFQVRKCGYAKR